MSGIYIAFETFKTFPADLQERVLERLVGSTSLPLAAASPVQSHVEAEPPENTASLSSEEGLLDLSPALARRFLNGCRPKTTAALTAMVSGPSPRFQLATVARALKVPVAELSGVWSGLTRRSRTVSRDDEAILLGWDPKTVKYNDAGEYADQVGFMTELTYKAFRKAFNID